MSYWPFWAGGLALAGVALGHWLLVGRLMAVSGRFSALVNRVRWGARPTEAALSEAELLLALQAATAESFGAASVAAPTEQPATSAPTSASRQPLWLHLLFLAGLIGGGALASAQRGVFELSRSVQGVEFALLFGDGPARWWPLAVGGLLVGFGTRMAGGCTSGHGLCGVSRAQPGSLFATCAFFGAGIATSLALRAVLT